ncbi:hypothetical protein D3C87_1909790 [compost metagenome]
MNRDTCMSATNLEAGGQIRILKASPTADVINEDRRKANHTALNIAEELNQCITPFQAQTALAHVGINSDDFERMRRGVKLDGV